MISEETNKPHEKHAKLARPAVGTFGRNEIAIVGTTCANIRKLAYSIMSSLGSYKISYLDADHKQPEEVDKKGSALDNGAFLEYTDKVGFHRYDRKVNFNPFQQQSLLSEQDLVLVNGNHFSANVQIVVVDPVKDLLKKVDTLTDVRLILLKEETNEVPEFLREIPGVNQVPKLYLDDANGITTFVNNFLAERVPSVNGLVLSGGKSSRMQKDKGNLNYHGMSQREFLFGLLSTYCKSTFISCNAVQAPSIQGFPIIEDTFLHLGPMGGILSAMQRDPNAAWLTIACDLPFLSEKTIEFLLQKRNPSRIATAFYDAKGEFPEPLITIWEPKSYPVLLQFLAQGHSCPRKVLINSDIQLLHAPDQKEFTNVNLPEEFEEALRELTIH